jgi:hypothetical protein
VKRKTTYPKATGDAALILKETAEATAAEPMLRTQIYLSRAEHDFLQREASRRDQPMAAVIRGFIDEKMTLPEDAWTNNPMLEPMPRSRGRKGHEDAGINHDHYIYGCPKKWIKVKGEYIEAPPLPDDYYSNRASADAYDRKIKKLDETR